MCASDDPRTLDAASDGLMAAHREALAPVTDSMLALAQLQPGQRVLDVGSGNGELAVLAAARVGPDGYVLATDIDAGPLDALLRSPEVRAFANRLTARTVAAEDLLLDSTPFDVALARNCVMYFHDLFRAVASIRGMLCAGGQFVLSLYGPREREPFHDVALSAVERRRTLHDPLPQYAQAFCVDSATVVSALAAADFDGIEERVVPTLRTYPSLDLALGWLQHSPSLDELLARLDPSTRADAWHDIATGLRRFETAAGLRIPGEQVVITARARDPA